MLVKSEAVETIERVCYSQGDKREPKYNVNELVVVEVTSKSTPGFLS